ncbi:sentrin-specific protease 5 [Engraulis encrasicolus]|uniref:sentrin-specific protease 5 n=1 Tax=Engraulis encrasicolus TaxID=184585 RepID=UPI002FD5FEF6
MRLPHHTSESPEPSEDTDHAHNDSTHSDTVDHTHKDENHISPSPERSRRKRVPKKCDCCGPGGHAGGHDTPGRGHSGRGRGRGTGTGRGQGRGHPGRGRGHSASGRGHSVAGRSHSGSGRGHSVAGRGHSGSGRGHSLSDRGHSASDRGRGHSVAGRGHSGSSRGHSLSDRGHSASDRGRARGHSGRGRGHNASIRGHSAPGRGHSAPGRGHSATGRGRGQHDVSARDDGVPARGHSLSTRGLPVARRSRGRGSFAAVKDHIAVTNHVSPGGGTAKLAVCVSTATTQMKLTETQEPVVMVTTQTDAQADSTSLETTQTGVQEGSVALVTSQADVHAQSVPVVTTCTGEQVESESTTQTKAQTESMTTTQTHTEAVAVTTTQPEIRVLSVFTLTSQMDIAWPEGDGQAEPANRDCVQTVTPSHDQALSQSPASKPPAPAPLLNGSVGGCSDVEMEEDPTMKGEESISMKADESVSILTDESVSIVTDESVSIVMEDSVSMVTEEESAVSEEYWGQALWDHTYCRRPQTHAHTHPPHTDDNHEGLVDLIHEYLEEFYGKYGSFIPLSEDDIHDYLTSKAPADLSDRKLVKSEVAKYKAGLATPTQHFCVSHNKHTLTLEDLSTLDDHSWVNDQVINMYGELIMEAANHKVHFFNSFFYRQLVAKGYEGVKRWTKKVDLFSKSLLLIPLHLEVHWSLLSVDVASKSIHFYDSQGIMFKYAVDNILKYLLAEAKEKKQLNFQKGWKMIIQKNIPQQKNDSDCGVFVLEYCKCLAQKRDLLFSQDDMPRVRKRIYQELCEGKLRDAPSPSLADCVSLMDTDSLKD